MGFGYGNPRSQQCRWLTSTKAREGDSGTQTDRFMVSHGVRRQTNLSLFINDHRRIDASETAAGHSYLRCISQATMSLFVADF